MPQLRLDRQGSDAKGHDGEVFGVAFAPDGAMLLSAGWDGCLRLWEATAGVPISSLQASSKALSACGVTPDGRQWISASMEGLLACWDPTTHRQTAVLLAHTRPISGITFSPDGATLATMSWDRSAFVWNRLRDRDGRALAGHEDVVAGGRFTPDGTRLVTWSHDQTVRLWDVATGRCHAALTGHQERVVAGAVSPDGAWAATGSRDRVLKLWDLAAEREVRAACLGGEVRGCFFLPDAGSLLCADANGRLTLHTVPDLREVDELLTRLPVQCVEAAPAGTTFALGCADGRVRFGGIDGLDAAPLIVTPTRTEVVSQTRLQRLFGRRRVADHYSCTCPVCRQTFDLEDGRPGSAARCPSCQRDLRLSRVARLRQAT